VKLGEAAGGKPGSDQGFKTQLSKHQPPAQADIACTGWGRQPGWRVHTGRGLALRGPTARGCCPLGTVARHGPTQMCLQVLPLLLVHDTAIYLLRYQGQALSAKHSASVAARENSPCRGEVCCHRNPCRWQSQPLYTCTRDHLKRTEGAGTRKGMWPELTGTTIPTDWHRTSRQVPTSPCSPCSHGPCTSRGSSQVGKQEVGFCVQF